MKSALAPAIALGLAASAFAQLAINTPSDAVACEPLQITWSPGTPPYEVSLLPGNQPTATALQNFPATNATEFTWVVDVAPNTALGLNLRDGTGLVVQSAAFTVQAGTSTSCVGNTTSISFGATATGGASATSQGSSPTAATSGTTPATSAGSSTAGTSAGSNTATSASTSATSSQSAGASRVSGQVAAAGIIGAAMVALLG